MKEAKVKYDVLTAYTKKILQKLGYPETQADVTAWALVEADARGVNSHGVGRLEFYESNIKNGFNTPAAEPEIVHETPLSAVIDGHHGVGSYIARFAMNKVLEKAKSAGAGFAAVRNSNHFGMAALWGEMATAQGYIGMSFCNTRICSIVLFGKDRILGTNPMCFAIPSSGKVPFILDMATTTAAHGKVEVYERLNKAMPFGWCVDENGYDTTDVHAFQKIYREKKTGGHLFLGGSTEELGGHKGYGLGLFVDLICAGMSMGAWSRDTFVKNDGARIAQFFGAMRLDLFGKPAEIEAHVEEILQGVRNSAKAEGHDRIYIHGEKEVERKAKSMVEGVTIDDGEIKMLEDYAAKFGLEKIAYI
ncbi:MAG: Ldh family oxidoreductase [Acidobacteria bacterium]|nr:Ldh family oxidoreductase [Acidobacteriota bacterium]